MELRAGGMPIPVSATSRTLPASHPLTVRSDTTPPPRGVKRIALSRRFTMICLSRPRSPQDDGLFAAPTRRSQRPRSSAIRLHMLRGTQRKFRQVDIDPSRPVFRPRQAATAPADPDTRCSKRATSSRTLPTRSRIGQLSAQVRFAGQLLQLAFDDRQRRAQLMGCIRQEAARRPH
jgi:hypothetical protein